MSDDYALLCCQAKTVHKVLVQHPISLQASGGQDSYSHCSFCFSSDVAVVETALPIVINRFGIGELFPAAASTHLQERSGVVVGDLLVEGPLVRLLTPLQYLKHTLHRRPRGRLATGAYNAELEDGLDFVTVIGVREALVCGIGDAFTGLQVPPRPVGQGAVLAAVVGLPAGGQLQEDDPEAVHVDLLVHLPRVRALRTKERDR